MLCVTLVGKKSHLVKNCISGEQQKDFLTVWLLYLCTICELDKSLGGMIVWTRLNLEERLMDPRKKLGCQDVVLTWRKQVLGGTIDCHYWCSGDCLKCHFLRAASFFSCIFFFFCLLLFAFEEGWQKSNMSTCCEWTDSTCWAGACWGTCFGMKGREGVLRDWLPSAHTSLELEVFADTKFCPRLTQRQELWGFFFHLPTLDFALKSGTCIQEMQCQVTDTWDKLGVCGRGRRVKDLNIILRLGRNSPGESEYSCFPPVCLWYASTCSLNAEPKTIGGRARGPWGMLAAPNSYY